MQNFKELELALGYHFNNTTLLKQALTHCSFQEKDHPLADYERLEFLGDRLLNVLVAGLVYRLCPKDNEGTLAKRHAALVCEPFLADMARSFGVGDYLILGKGEDQTGGREKNSILADVVEALLAAMYLDAGEDIDVIRDLVESRWEPHVLTVELRDPKTALQEEMQAKGLPLPEYKLVEERGKTHERVFVFDVSAEGLGCVTVEGASKQEAQQKGARQLLEKLEKVSK